jgi:hypothetical protein
MYWIQTLDGLALKTKRSRNFGTKEFSTKKESLEEGRDRSKISKKIILK